MHIKKRIRFILHTRKKGDSVSGKNLTIRLRITYAGNTPIDFPTNCSIDAQDWDKENERAKENTVNQYGQTADDINNRINEYRAMAHEVFARYELIEKRVPEPYEVKDL